jgi:hypothetical protein
VSLTFGPLFVSSIALLSVTLCALLSTSKHDRSDERNSYFCVVTQCEDMNWIQLTASKFLLMNKIFSDGHTKACEIGRVYRMREGEGTCLHWFVWWSLKERSNWEDLVVDVRRLNEQ